MSSTRVGLAVECFVAAIKAAELLRDGKEESVDAIVDANGAKWHARNIRTITEKGGKVIHEVDAAVMCSRSELQSLRFDRIVFNFPHAGFNKLEPRHVQIDRQRNLVVQFLVNAKRLLSSGGEVHIAHKTTGFFAAWGVEELGALCGLSLVEKTGFELKDYPGYNNKYGDGGDQNFNCDPSLTCKFR